MKNCPHKLIVFPHNADLDHLGAARCLLLMNPDAAILHPVRFHQNTWDTARRLDWFKTVKFENVDFAALKTVYLVGITHLKQNQEFIEAIAKFSPRVIVISDRSATLPLEVETEFCGAMSLTAWLVNRLRDQHLKFSNEDMQMFRLAVTEKTWAGLSARVKPEDQKAIAFLDRQTMPPGRIANTVVLGMHEGQTALYRQMLKNIEDIQPGYWPVTLVAVKVGNQVQDIEPVVDAIWSDTSPPVLMLILTFGNFTRVWCRSSISQIDFRQIFADFRPARLRNWVYFSFSGAGHEQNRSRVLQHLEQNLQPDLTAGDIMSASPQCIDWHASVRNAFDTMLKFNIMSLIVMQKGEFAGIVTRRDLDRALQMNLLDSEIGPYVPTSVPIVSPTTPVRVLKNLMVRYNLTRLPVLNGTEVVGIITTHELLRSLPDYLPLPHDFLPLAEQVSLPTSSELEKLLKLLFSLRIYHILQQIGRFAGQQGVNTFAVGGFVRDLLLERQNFDIDIVVIGDAIPFAIELSREFACDYKVYDRFHTARIYLEDLKIDFSSARIEHYSDPGALPQIEFSGLSNDLYRRDFTINTLALSLNPEHFLELKDFFGGYNDLLNRRIRILHSFSFLEDPTRLFRAIRFAGRFNFALEQDTQRAFELAINREAPEKLSLKRIGAEISRCLNEERPQQIVADLFSAGLMKYLSPEMIDADILPRRFKLIRSLIKRFKPLGEEIDSEAIFWTGILSVIRNDNTEKILDALGTPHSRRRLILQALTAIQTVPTAITKIEETDATALYYLLHELSLEAMLSVMAFALDKRNARKILHFIMFWRSIKCDVSGNDLIAEGIKPGPHMRNIFSRIIEQKLKGSRFTREEELALAKQLYQNL
ncbi:MAG: CBS domain-containing protein [Candidatus Riflebacteria bacterium]|nr:CBS domain-containing protein [Candidatus Riflebacteria bacterium]